MIKSPKTRVALDTISTKYHILGWVCNSVVKHMLSMLLSVGVYFNNGVIPHRVTMLPLRAIRYLTRPHKHGKSPFELLVRGLQESPQTI